MAAVELIIFDNDGVLVDSESISANVLGSVLNDLGVDVDRGVDGRRFLGSTMAGVRAMIESDLDAPLAPDFEQRYHDALFLRFDAELSPIGGVIAALDSLDEIDRCVASSGTRDRVAHSLAVTGLSRYFAPEAVFSADDVSRGKPAPDLFLHAADRMDSATARCVVVEDSPAGVDAALAAGMFVVGYAAQTPADRLERADVIITEMTDLPGLIGSLARATRK